MNSHRFDYLLEEVITVEKQYFEMMCGNRNMITNEAWFPKHELIGTHSTINFTFDEISFVILRFFRNIIRNSKIRHWYT